MHGFKQLMDLLSAEKQMLMDSVGGNSQELPNNSQRGIQRDVIRSFADALVLFPGRLGAFCHEPGVFLSCEQLAKIR